jgi:catechol 2,3-dioxygenase-like lactoylglutathione lyase family enzyme
MMYGAQAAGYGAEVAYIALVAADVEAAARMFEKDYELRRSTKKLDGREVPLLSVGQTALALFAPGDPYVDGTPHTGVHHFALAVDDLEAAMGDITKRGVVFESDKIQKSLDDGKRALLSLKATNGIRTYISTKVDREPSRAGFIERIDHLGIMGTDNPTCIDTYCQRLGLELTGEQFDTEIQTPVEHFVYRTPKIERVVMHTRQSELVANVHDLFVLAGDWDLEIIQPMNTTKVVRASGEKAGDTMQDHGVVDRFLKERGPGLHHIAFKVTDIDKHLTRFGHAGYRMIDKVGRRGARLSHIGFIHPSSTQKILTHLVERPDL